MLADTLKALLLLCLIRAARTVADPVKGRAPGSSEQPHRSGERKHGRSAPLNASPLKQPPLGSVGSSSAPRSRALGGKSGMTRAEPLVLLCGFQGEAFLLAVGDDVAIGTVTRMGRDKRTWLAWLASE